MRKLTPSEKRAVAERAERAKLKSGEPMSVRDRILAALEEAERLAEQPVPSIADAPSRGAVIQFPGPGPKSTA